MSEGITAHRWHMGALSDLGTWQGGGTPSKSNNSYWSDGTIPWVSPKDMKVFRIHSTQDLITEEAVRNSSANILPAQSVAVVTRSGILERTLPVAVVEVEAAVNQDLKVLTPREGIHAAFVAYFLRGNEREILGRCSKNGTTVASIDFTRLLRFPIPIPPLDEQKQIVEAIETQFARLDAAVASLKRARARLKRYRASVLKAACEGRLVPTEAELARQEGRGYEPASVLLERIRAEREAASGTKRGKAKTATALDISVLPKLPEGWAWTRVIDIGSVGTGATPLRSNTDFYAEGTIPWVTSGALNNDFVREPTEFVTELALQRTNLSLYPMGTLLIAMYGEGKTRGKCSELFIEATTNQAIAAIILSGTAVLTKGFLKLFLMSNYEEMRRSASGGVQPNLNLSIIKNITAPFPPLAEQERIVAEVERLMSVIEQMDATVEANLKRAESLRQSILRLAFSGRLTRTQASR